MDLTFSMLGYFKHSNEMFVSFACISHGHYEILRVAPTRVLNLTEHYEIFDFKFSPCCERCILAFG